VIRPIAYSSGTSLPAVLLHHLRQGTRQNSQRGGVDSRTLTEAFLTLLPIHGRPPSKRRLTRRRLSAWRLLPHRLSILR